jgi:RNA ligase (TIGR02306 family)
MRKLASIQRILDVQPIENADNIVVATVLGWKLVVKKDDFKSGKLAIGKLACYIEIDSVLPSTNPAFAFMEKTKYRVKTVRLRGQISQGLLLPIEDLFTPDQVKLLTEDSDVTELLGIVKYEPPEVEGFHQGQRKGNFPSFIPKTDEIRVQSLQGLLNKYAGTKAYAAIKCDGSSATYYYILEEDKFRVCSRNFEKKFDETTFNSDAFCELALSIGLSEKLKKYCQYHNLYGIAVQGELCGPGIQKNRMKLNEKTLFVYNVFLIKEHSFMSGPEMVCACEEMGLKTVPIISWNEVIHTDIQKYVDDVMGLRHPSYSGNDIEGVVIRPVREIIDDRHGRVSFKVINNNYLLKHGE